MALAALVLVVWFALGVVAIGLVNFAKWTVGASTRADDVDDRSTTTWPAPQPAPTPTRQPASATGGRRSGAGIGRVDLEPTTPG